ncbi:unnamed protein product, partial [Lymnaea stagnalis]
FSSIQNLRLFSSIQNLRLFSSIQNLRLLFSPFQKIRLFSLIAKDCPPPPPRTSIASPTPKPYIVFPPSQELNIVLNSNYRFLGCLKSPKLADMDCLSYQSPTWEEEMARIWGGDLLSYRVMM